VGGIEGEQDALISFHEKGRVVMIDVFLFREQAKMSITSSVGE